MEGEAGAEKRGPADGKALRSGPGGPVMSCCCFPRCTARRACEALLDSRGREVATGRFAVKREGKGGEEVCFSESAW